MRQFLAVAAALIASCTFVPKAAHPEDTGVQPTFFPVCWAKGEAYTYATQIHNCASPAEVVWDHLPVTVWADDYNRTTVEKALEVWKGFLGWQPFKLVVEQWNADVLVGYGGDSDWWLGSALPLKDFDDRLWFQVKIYSEGLGSVFTMVHELGHTLALDHDPNNARSIMYPSDARFMPWLASEDRDALNWRYRNLIK